MYCKKAILVNWGNIPNLEFEFGPINLFSGGNGSGKTTAADAIQSLMTASYENLFNYNPGQDETTQRGRGGKQVRTLASYVLGCDDGSYSRPKTTDGYIVGVFHPTSGETGTRFTAVMGVRATLETVGKQRQARQQQLRFFILADQALSIDEFVNNGRVADLDKLEQTLKTKYGKSAVEMYEKKGLYLNRLYGAFRSQNGSVAKREAQHAAKTFSNFMAYKPVKSINEFVAREILEPRDLSDGIKQVSELMKTIHNMESETRKITDVIDNLLRTQDISTQYIDRWLAWRIDELRELVRQSWVKQRAYVATKNAQSDNSQSIQDVQSRLNKLNDKRQTVHDNLVTLEAKRQGIPALKDKDQLEKEIEKNRGHLVTQAQQLYQHDQQIIKNHQAATQLKRLISESSIAIEVPELEQKSFTKQLTSLLGAGDQTGISIQKLLTQDLAGIANLEHSLDKLLDFEKTHQGLVTVLHQGAQTMANGGDHRLSLRDKLMQISTKLNNHQAALNKELAQKKREIHKLENQSINYPSQVELAVNAIQQQCPQARPAVLCDFINITDPKWQVAIEAYIGGKRFGILVEPEYEAQAIRIVRNLPNRRNSSNIIQGSKAQRDSNRYPIPNKSIVEVMSFDHKIAEYYINVSYGNVLRVADEQALTGVNRGVTADGMGAGGYSMFRCDIDETDLVFGKAARERALNAKKQQLMELQRRAFDAEQRARSVLSICESIDQIKTVDLSETIRSMLQLTRTIESNEQQIASLDLSDFAALEEQLASNKRERDELESQQKERQTELGQLQNQTTHIDRQVKDLNDQVERLQEQQEACESELESLAEIHSDFDAQQRIEEAETQALQHAKLNDDDDSFDRDIAEHQGACERFERALHQCVMQHNQHCNQHDSIVYLVDTGASGDEAHNKEWFKRVVVISKEVRSITNRLKNNVLVGKHEQLSELRESFNDAFVSDLCHSIYHSINSGKRILDELNKELESHRFGTDQERYYFSYSWVPEFREYQRFFKEVINLDLTGNNSLFETELSAQSTSVRTKLLSMLLDNDEQQALKELKRISDYRHYRAYEIYKEPAGKAPIPLSEYGTGSGGQLETPAYIIRSAAITSAFKFNEGSSHCRMVLVDEAFSKMDEARSREVIHYLTNELGLQLIFIMPTSKSGPFMDLISHQTIFSKCPISTPNHDSELNTQVLVDRKVCNQDKIKTLWAQHRRNIKEQTSLDFMQEFLNTNAST